MINKNFPEAMRYYRAAAMHLEGATTIVKQCPSKSWSFLAHEATYLSGYVVECSFKALILNRTPPKKHAEVVEEFRLEVKHNLDKLRHLLSLKGVDLPATYRPMFVLVRSQWSAQMRYQPHQRDRKDATDVRDAAMGLYQWLDRV
jgi:hypothetical protein